MTEGGGAMFKKHNKVKIKGGALYKSNLAGKKIKVVECEVSNGRNSNKDIMQILRARAAASYKFIYIG